MKKVFFSSLISALLLSFFLTNNIAVAVEITNPLAYDTFEKIVGAISRFLFNIGLALAPVMLIIAGFMYVTSAGDPKRVETAKKLVLYTLIGLAIILLASGLIKVLESILGVTGT